MGKLWVILLLLCAEAYRKNLKNLEFGQEGLQNFCSERVTIAERQGTSENKNFEVNLTPPKTDSSGCFDIYPIQKKRIELASYSHYLLPFESLPLFYKAPRDTYPMKFDRVRREFNLIASYDVYEYVKQFKFDDSNLKKIIFFDYCKDPQIHRLPKPKMILFKWEAIKIADPFYDPFSIVYTFDDDLVDGIKFFKFHYPSLLPMQEDLPPFEERKLCTMVVSNWTPERIQILKFFESKREKEFEFYGKGPEPFQDSPMYRGTIDGYYSGHEKLSVLKKYRFCICFENTHTTKGYITEKIFHCFATGCIPVYWGPDNVEDYIPGNCFIDYRDFHSDEELYLTLKSMSKDVYEETMENIKNFLKSDAAQLFSPDAFDKTLYEAACR